MYAYCTLISLLMLIVKVFTITQNIQVNRQKTHKQTKLALIFSFINLQNIDHPDNDGND